MGRAGSLGAAGDGNNAPVVDELRVRVLGGFAIDGVDARSLGSRKARTLLQVLALARGRPVTVDQLVDHLWSDSAPARPEEQVRVLISRLRRVLGADRLPHADAGYALAIDWFDLDALAEAVAVTRREAGDGHASSARQTAEEAIALLGGDLLPEAVDAEWAEVDRALAARLGGEARRLAAAAALDDGDPAAAALLAERALDHDPYDEVALRTLMVALDRCGRPASALAAYAAVRVRLADDLGVDPSADTELLHTAMLVSSATSGSSNRAGDDAVASADRAVASADESPLPGRDTELELLDAALARAREGLGGLVVVEGEAGIGKSRLLATWARRARRHGATVITGRCEEVAGGLPLQAVGDALADHLRGMGRSAVAEVLGPAARVVAPLVGATSEPLPIASARDHEGARLELYAALVDVLARLPAPLVLVVDDVHLADRATLEWAYLAVRRAAHLPLLVVVAQREEESRPLPNGLRIRLGPLDEDDAARLVGPERAAELVARSGGNPLFLTELAAADADDTLPASLLAAVAATCERTGPAAVTLRVAALLGPTVDVELLGSVLAAAPSRLVDHIEEGVRRRLLVEGEDGTRFRHALVREALDEGVGPTRRAAVHRAAAAALEARHGHDPVVVAHHARAGGDRERLARALVEAALVASRRHHQPEALAMLDEAVLAADGVEARLARALVNLMLGDTARARADAEVAAALGGGADAFELGAWAAHYERDFDVAVRLADDGVRLATDDEERVRCLAIGGWTSQCAGSLPDAERRLTRAAELATGRWRPLSEVWLAGLRVHQGRCTEGLALIRPSTLEAGLGQHANPDLHAHLFSAIALANLGRPEEALAAVAAIDRAAGRPGSARWVGRADNTRGWILRGLGELGAADDANARALERSAAGALLEPMAHAHLDLASGYLIRGDPAAAAREVDGAEAVGHDHAMAWRHGLRAELLRSDIARHDGDLDRAEELADLVVRRASRAGTERYVALGSLAWARARIAAGAQVDLEALEALLSRLDRVASVEAWRLTAAVAAEAGVDRWWSLAEKRVVSLARQAGPHRATLERVAGDVLDNLARR